jgi:hypothetical protein
MRLRAKLSVGPTCLDGKVLLGAESASSGMTRVRIAGHRTSTQDQRMHILDGSFRMKAVVIGTLLLLALALRAQAQEVPDPERGRFSFQQLPEGTLRLDSRTGQVSVCSKRAVGWACQAVSEDRAALESEIARLQAENAALRRELSSHGIATPDGGKPPSFSAKPDEDGKWPSNADLDRAMSFLERAWHRLVEMVQRLQREMESEKDRNQLDKQGPEKKG